RGRRRRFSTRGRGSARGSRRALTALTPRATVGPPGSRPAAAPEVLGALLPADELHRLRATEPAAGGGGVHPPLPLPPPRLPRLLPGGALVGQAPQRAAAACAPAGAPQGVGLRGLRGALGIAR